MLEIENRVAAYDQQVLVNKEVTLKGTGGQPTIDFTGTVTGKPTLFDISANNVTIENIHFNVDLARLRSAVIASAAGIDNVTIKNNLVDPYGTPVVLMVTEMRLASTMLDIVLQQVVLIIFLLLIIL